MGVLWAFWNPYQAHSYLHGVQYAILKAIHLNWSWPRPCGWITITLLKNSGKKKTQVESSDGVTLDLMCYCASRLTTIKGIASNKDNGTCLDSSSPSAMTLVRTNTQPWWGRSMGRSVMSPCAAVVNLDVYNEKTALTNTVFSEGNPCCLETREQSCFCCFWY